MGFITRFCVQKISSVKIICFKIMNERKNLETLFSDEDIVKIQRVIANFFSYNYDRSLQNY